jgi:general secretion pathway protein D
MASHLTFTRLVAASAFAVLLAGCAAQQAFREGQALAAEDKTEAALLKYQAAIAADPGNAAYRAAFLRARDRSATRLLTQADRALADGHPAPALQDYRRVLALDPANERALAGLRAVESDLRLTEMLAAARTAFDARDFDGARARTSAILTERPDHEGARQLQAEIAEKNAPVAVETALAAAYRQPISLEFRDTQLKQVLELISRRSGLNFIFDKDVKTDQKTSIVLKNSTVEAAIYYLMVSNQLEQQVMDANTIMIFPNVAAKLKEYQEMTVKTFFLANADAKSIANTLKTILKSRDVVIDEKLNLVILRDSPEAVRMASRLVALQDVPEPEVMLDVEILEIKRSRVMELGIAWPTNLTLAPLTTVNGGPLTLEALRHLGRADIGVSGLSAQINANKTDGDSNTLANPRIRVRNKEKAKIVIGDKIPNITATVSSGVGGFATESVNYLDVGLTLNVEPTIYLNNEVAIRISLEVSNLGPSITTKSGTIAYQIGSRQASTMLQLKDGENQVLAGLINNEDRSSGSKIPGLGDLPIAGRLFGSGHDENNKTEIVLSITPHLIRNIVRPSAAAAEFNAGTETSFRRRPDTAPRLPAVLPAAPGAVLVRPATTTPPAIPAGTQPIVPAPAPSPPAGAAAAPSAAAAAPTTPATQETPQGTTLGTVQAMPLGVPAPIQQGTPIGSPAPVQQGVQVAPIPAPGTASPPPQ